MDLHRLRCAVAIADHGSFSEAAAHLGLSQPTLSHAIARLEQELGVRLFDRTPSGTRPTAEGQRMLGPARRALLEAENVRSAIDSASGSLTGILRLACIRTAVDELVDLTSAFHATHDRVHLVLRDPAGDREVALALRDGLADVGLMRTRAVPDDLDAVPAGEQQVVAFFPAGTGPRHRALTAEMLRDREFIAPLEGSRVRRAFDAVADGLDLRPRIIAECSYQETTLELVRRGVGVSLGSSRSGMVDDLDGVDVRPITGLTTQISVVTSRWPSPAAAAFRELAREHPGG